MLQGDPSPAMAFAPGQPMVASFSTRSTRSSCGGVPVAVEDHFFAVRPFVVVRLGFGSSSNAAGYAFTAG